MSTARTEREEMLAHDAEVWAHNRAAMERFGVPSAARRGVNKAAGFGAEFVTEIERRERAGGGVYLLVFTSWRKDAERADHCHIVGPRGRCTKAY